MFRTLLFPVLTSLGGVLLAFAGLMLVPAAYSWLEADGAFMAFLKGTLITAASGAALFALFRPFKRELKARHGFLLVTLAWALMPAFAMIPVLICLPQYSVSQIYFEMMSCITTTGSTVITGLDSLPPSLNGWRCFLSWLGGMGIIVLSVAILPLLGIGGAQIMKAETTGPLKETRLTPRIAETARALYIIYFGLSVVCTIAFHLAGMSWQDAVMHMMTTTSLSGIAAHDRSFGYFESAAVEMTTAFFMLVCSLNFSLHFVAWRRRRLLTYFCNTEARVTLAFSVCLSLAVACMLWTTHTYADPLEALQAAIFATISAISTTGFSSADWALWPCGIPIILLCASSAASSSGSTGGGLKMLRVIILFKQLRHEFLRLLYPSAVTPVTVDGEEIPGRVVFSVLAFIFIWLLSAAAGAFVLLIAGMPPLEAISASIASINNLGPGLGTVGPAGNYQALTDFQLDCLSFLMLAGRLEIFTVFVLFTRTFWKS